MTKAFIILISVALLPSLGFAVTQIQPPPTSWNADSQEYTLYGDYFSSQANYDGTRGSFTRLPGDNSLGAFRSALRGRYGLSNRLSVYLGTRYSFTRTIDPVLEKTNSGLDTVFTGANFLLWRRYFWAVPEIEVGYPITQTATSQTAPYIGDGAPYVRGGIFLFKAWKRLRVAGYFGADIPFDQLAKLLVYEMSVEAKLGSIFLLGGSFGGYETFLSDGATQAERVANAGRANSGSFRYQAYDPALMELRTWVGLRPDRGWLLKLGYGKTLDGLRSAEGQSFLFSVNYSIPSTKSTKKRPTPIVADEKDFEVQVEESSPDLFDGSSDLDKVEQSLEKPIE